MDSQQKQNVTHLQTICNIHMYSHRNKHISAARTQAL